MKIIHSAVASALLATTFISTPAMAAKPPIADTTGMTPQEVCDAQLTPAEASEFQTIPQGETPGTWVDVGAPYADEDAGPSGPPEGYGTPIYSDFVFDGTYFRNGGSPNVWGGATATAYYPQTRQLWPFLQDQTSTTTFDCYVWKYVGPETHENLVEPEGLQSTGNSTVAEQTVSAGEDYIITDDDFLIYELTVNTLICISPNNATKGKPGTWTKKHGFTGSCTEASTIAGTTFIPSNNAPIVD